MKSYLLLTESAIDSIITQRLFSEEVPGEIQYHKSIFKENLAPNIIAFATKSDRIDCYSALINKNALATIVAQSPEFTFDVYSRIARFIKALARPPIHLPRQWSEFHYKNLVSFFVSPRQQGDSRWVVINNNDINNARFEEITDGDTLFDIKSYIPPEPIAISDILHKWIDTLKKAPLSDGDEDSSFSEEFDLSVVGGKSIVSNKNYAQWLSIIKDGQKQVLDAAIKSSVRISGPAGSGKTLALCLRALKIAREESVISEEKKILFITHSWAMAERIDKIIFELTSGNPPSNVTILPLFDALQNHTRQIGIKNSTVLSEDSEKGRHLAMDIIKLSIGSNPSQYIQDHLGLSSWLQTELERAKDIGFDLIFNLYEEFNGVIGGLGVSTDDSKSIKEYLLGENREDWMPPFITLADRKFVITIYNRFIRLLWDRGVITTDQFILDSVRVLETFTWKMQRETDGYDFIFIDELQLFNTQERLAAELLSRAKEETVFSTAEDPSQGSFSTLYARKALGVSGNEAIYLSSVHRFNKSIYELIRFFYQKAQLNAVPIRINNGRSDSGSKPAVYTIRNKNASQAICGHVKNIVDNYLKKSTDRLCIATLGEPNFNITSALEELKIQAIKLSSFDDIEELSYRKKSIVVSPWQYIGGTQFSTVIVIIFEDSNQNTAYGKLRQLISLYLACSRATDKLDIVCLNHIPQLLQDAIDKRVLTVGKYN